MRGANLGGAQLQGASLNEAEMQSADLGGTEMQGARLGGAQMQGADLTGAQLQGAHLNGAQLQGAHLDGAQLQRAHLDGAQLQGAWLRRAQFQGADLWGAQLQGAWLARAQLLAAQMQGAWLEGAQMQGADLTWAQLQGASLLSIAAWRASLEEEPSLTEFGVRVRPEFRASLGEEKLGLEDLDLRSTGFAPDPPSNRDHPGRLRWQDWVDAWLGGVPHGRRRDDAARLLSILIAKDDVVRDQALQQRWLNVGQPVPGRIADRLASLACATEDAPHIARGLIRQLSLSTGFRDPGAVARSIAEGLSKVESCPGARSLTDDDRAQLARIATGRD
jgi:uncharacterized protein YjbI with pentapeptide repeats